MTRRWLVSSRVQLASRDQLRAALLMLSGSRLFGGDIVTVIEVAPVVGDLISVEEAFLVSDVHLSISKKW